MPLGLEIAGGVILLVGTILTVVFTIVFTAVRKSRARQRAELEHEGIVLDSGRCRATFRYRGYREPGYYAGVSVRVMQGEIVLTRAQLVVFGRRVTRIPRTELRRYAVSQDGDALMMTSDTPFGATGHMSVRLSVPDAAGWVRTLHEAGATGG